jgi:DDE superfamily endonuclease
MPTLVWHYLTALLYYRTSVSCVALAEALQTASHDRLPRLLQATWSGPTRLELAVRTLFVWERGDLIIDDTVLPKPFATAIEGLAWVFSSQARKPV